MNELTYEELIKIHQATLALHGGLPGIKNEGSLRSALAQPQMSAFGVDAYPTIIDKVAALGFSLAKSHAFHDGNKRVAFIAMSVFLLRNGYRLAVEEDEVIRFMLQLADGTQNIERKDVADWLKSYLVETPRYSFGEFIKAMDVLIENVRKIPVYGDTFTDRMYFYDSKLAVLESWMDRASSIVLIQVKKDVKGISQEMQFASDNYKGLLPAIRSSVEIIESYAPYIRQEIGQLAESDRMDLFLSYGRTLDSTSAGIDSTREVREVANKCLKTMRRFKAPDNDLVQTLDDICSIFNQNWFAFKDIVDELKKR